MALLFALCSCLCYSPVSDCQKQTSETKFETFELILQSAVPICSFRFLTCTLLSPRVCEYDQLTGMQRPVAFARPKNIEYLDTLVYYFLFCLTAVCHLPVTRGHTFCISLQLFMIKIVCIQDEIFRTDNWVH